MKNILIITSSFDFTVDYLINKFKNKANFYRFNTDFFEEYSIDISNNKGWSISSKVWTIREEDIYSIYYRKPTLPKLEKFDFKYHSLMYKDMISIIDGILEVFNGRCLTKPSILRKSENKIFQLRIAEELNFNIPKSLITNSDNLARRFCKDEIRIVKPLSMGRLEYQNKIGIIQTNVVDKSIPIEGLGYSAAYFQNYVNKDYEVRATIINKKSHVVRIDSEDKVDWRKSDSKNKYSKIDLPKDIEIKCLNMLNKLDLNFGAFDFIVNDGKFIFLEVNPNGQWYWLEEELDLKISNDIFNFLSGEKLWKI